MIRPVATETKDKKMDVNIIIEAREKVHGKFWQTAATSVALKSVMNLERLNATQAEALAMIASKIARIVNGNPNEIDHWVDIQAYAKLVADEIEGVQP